MYGDNNPLSSPVFDRCTTQHGSMTARQALDIMVGQPDLTDLELARLASILGRVTLAICVTS